MGELLTSTLSRSLDPLPGEGLAGFLLRLAWRLRVTPQQLARFIQCGNAGPRQLSRRLLIELNVPAFAAATNLTATEAVELTLLPWADRYPPIGHAVASIRADRNTRLDEWLFHADVRYCPACLAGDGTAIQQYYGGPWKKIWHLPIAFACPEHHAFLRDTCPRQHPIVAAPHLLITPASASVLHPAQCRSPADPASRSRHRPSCAARLDHAPPPDHEPRPAVLNTQRRLAALLDPRTPADDATHIFTNLRVAVSLLYVSWPASRDLLEPHTIAAISEHIGHLNAGNRTSYDCLSPGLHATAAILTAALNILDHPDLLNALVREIGKTQTVRPSRTPLASALDRHRTACSPELREAIEPAIRRYRRQAGPSSPKAPTRFGGYQPAHIPAFLEDAWFDRHLAPLHCRSRLSRVLRRAVAATLVQWSAGGALGDAAHYLGINPNGGQYAFTKDLYQWLDNDPARTRFTAALENLAAELDTTAVLIDYRLRRDALHAWGLEEQTWAEIINQLPPVPGPVQPTLDDRKRQEASAFIWARITQGEPRFAPRPIEAQQPPHTQREWLQRRANTWHHLTREAPLAHYEALKNILTHHADLLIAKIDPNGSRTRR